MQAAPQCVRTTQDVIVPVFALSTSFSKRPRQLQADVCPAEQRLLSVSRLCMPESGYSRIPLSTSSVTETIYLFSGMGGLARFRPCLVAEPIIPTQYCVTGTQTDLRMDRSPTAILDEHVNLVPDLPFDCSKIQRWSFPSEVLTPCRPSRSQCWPCWP